MTEAIRYTRDAEGVVTLTIDLPGESVNTMNAVYAEAMEAAVARLEADRDAIRGVIVTSAKETFFAGGDLKLLIGVTPERAAEFAAGVDAVKGQLRRLETLGRPVVAAINGSALGGGWEIALACHRRICVDSTTIRLGLPEVTLGLLPGAGGVTRMVRLLGLMAALPLLVEGKKLRPADAVTAGLVHELASDRDAVLARAKAWILSDPEAVQPWDRSDYTLPGGSPTDPGTGQMLAAAPAVLTKKTHGAYPAPEKILATAVEGALVDVDTALAIETRHFVDLATGQIAKNMIGTFWFQLNEIHAGRSRSSGVDRKQVGRVGVLGAGMMGAGIAYVSGYAGIEVVLKDVSVDAAARGKAYSERLLDRRVGRGRMAAGRRDAILARITPTDADADLAGCDLVIEAVFEDRALKGQVVAAAEARALPDAVIASNTSTLPITGLAAAVPDPSRFIGLHFFSPVDKMPLVEIIRGEKTSDETLARAFDYVLQIGKTPIVVNDSRGFYTSRCFSTYALEGIAMVGEGVPAALVENVARKAGMAVGPLAVSDEVSLSLMWKIRNQTVADLAAEGRTVPEHPAMALVDTFVNALGRSGKAGGAGFYEYPADGGRKFLWPELASRYGGASGYGGAPGYNGASWYGGTPGDDGASGYGAGVSGGPPAQEQDVRDRLLFVQAVEAVRCVEDGVVDSAAAANIGSILGWGFAPWSGGTLQFVNQYGLAGFVGRAEYLAERYGERFTPPPLLREKALRGERF